jgi:hypothetical protein
MQTAKEVADVLGINEIGIDHGLCEVLNVSPAILSSQALVTAMSFL